MATPPGRKGRARRDLTGRRRRGRDGPWAVGSARALHRSLRPGDINVTLRRAFENPVKKIKGNRGESRIGAMCEKRTYQVDRAFVGPHGEAVDVLQFEAASDGRPNLSGSLLVCQSLVGHLASLEIPGRDARPHLVHPQRPRHQRMDPSTMDGREDESDGQALQASRRGSSRDWCSWTTPYVQFSGRSIIRRPV